MNTDDLIFTGQTLNLQFTVKDENNNLVDISAATLSLTIKPSGNTPVIVVPTLIGDGTDGELEYTTIATDLSVACNYRAQGLITIGTKVYPTYIIDFTVSSRI